MLISTDNFDDMVMNINADTDTDRDMDNRYDAKNKSMESIKISY
jgi:hypothetical protein